MLEKKALWMGRFQPPTNAHMVMTKSVLQKWAHLVIGVVYNTPRPANIDPRWLGHIQNTDKDFVSNKNPFAPEEVVRMWRASILCEQFSERIEVVAMPRPQLFDFNVRFPKKEIDVVVTAPTIGEHDPLFGKRLALYPELMGRDAFPVATPYKLHNTDIRKLIRQGRAWEEFLPPGGIEVFYDIDDPRRINDLM